MQLTSIFYNYRQNMKIKTSTFPENTPEKPIKNRMLIPEDKNLDVMNKDIDGTSTVTISFPTTHLEF